MKGKKYLVTGGLGYIGSVLVDELVRRGSDVVTVDNGLTGRPRPASTNVLSVIGDVRSPAFLDELLPGVDGVVHLAAVVGDRACDIDPTLSWETNYLATVNVTDSCKRVGIRRLVLASTCSAYGSSLGQAAEVTSPLSPQSIYAETKVRAEHHVLAARDERFRPCIIRLSTIYGLSPRMRFDLAVNVMTARAVTEGQIFVHGGDQWRPLLHIQDAADAIVKALASTSGTDVEIYNCGSNDENYRMSDVGSLIASVVGDTHVTVRSDLPDTRNYRVNFESLTAGLGYRCTRRLHDGVLEIRDAVATGRYGSLDAPKYDNYLLTENFVKGLLKSTEVERMTHRAVPVAAFRQRGTE